MTSYFQFLCKNHKEGKNYPPHISGGTLVAVALQLLRCSHCCQSRAMFFTSWHTEKTWKLSRHTINFLTIGKAYNTVTIPQSPIAHLQTFHGTQMCCGTEKNGWNIQVVPLYPWEIHSQTADNKNPVFQRTGVGNPLLVSSLLTLGGGGGPFLTLVELTCSPYRLQNGLQRS